MESSRIAFDIQTREKESESSAEKVEAGHTVQDQPAAESSQILDSAFPGIVPGSFCYLLGHIKFQKC